MYITIGIVYKTDNQCVYMEHLGVPTFVFSLFIFSKIFGALGLQFPGDITAYKCIHYTA